MDFIYISGEERPKVIYEPYIYATMYECSKHYIIFSRRKVKMIKKKGK